MNTTVPFPSHQAPIKAPLIASHGAGFSHSDEVGLGIYAKSATPPLKPSDSRGKIQSIRADRYRLQNSARRLLYWAGQRAGLEYPSSFHRTADCMHVRHGSNVDVHRSRDHSGAFYGGLVTCGSVWACPVCAAKIQERRRVEIAKAFDWAYDNGNKVVMVTLTFPHTASQNLKDLLSMQASALKGLKGGRPWERIKKRHGFAGLIRSLEVTVGDNGWHPHTHEAWVVSANTDADLLLDTISKRWLTMCQRAGLVPDSKVSAFLRHAVHIVDNCSTSDYMAKQDDAKHWGMDRELAKGSSKTVEGFRGVHPFALLNRHSEGFEGAKKAGARYLEYVEAMHSKRQIFWSKGLKALVGVDDVDDSVLAEQSLDKADRLGLLDAGQWRLIVKHDHKALVLDAAESGGWAAVIAMVSGLESFPSDPSADPVPAGMDLPDPSLDLMVYSSGTPDHLMSFDAYVGSCAGRLSASIERVKSPSKVRALIDRLLAIESPE